jgi:hypothetical protein
MAGLVVREDDEKIPDLATMARATLLILISPAFRENVRQ